MSAVQTDGRISLPMDGPADEPIGLPMAAPPPPSPVAVTDRAARAFGEILSERGHTQGALKVAVIGGGCAGYEYAMALAHEPEPTDITAESNGVEVYIDGHTAHLIAGAEIDFIDSMMGRGFSVRNPNAETTCGCGSSFNTDGSGVTAGACGK